MRFSVFIKSILFMIQIKVSYSIDNHHREKRFLIFPRGNPTRHQFIAGIGIPVDLEPETMTIGYVLKAQYFLPYNESHLYPTRLEKRDIAEIDENDEKLFDIEGDETKFNSLESFDAAEIDENDSLDDSVRWSIYHTVDMLLRQKMKTNGMQCVLRYICEASQLPFSHESGLLGEILHVLFVPSTSSSQRNDFTRAEEIGKSNSNCENVFPQCTFSLLDLISMLN